MRLPSFAPAVVHAGIAGLLLAGALAGCNRAEQPPAPTTDGTDTAPAPPADAPDDGGAMVTMR